MLGFVGKILPPFLFSDRCSSLAVSKKTSQTTQPSPCNLVASPDSEEIASSDNVRLFLRWGFFSKEELRKGEAWGTDHQHCKRREPERNAEARYEGARHCF